jgi:RNA polymerase sigma factor (sigma-70 family)
MFAAQLELAKAGDHEALANLCWLVNREIRFVLLWKNIDADFAADMLQECYLRFLLYLKSIRNARALKHYIRRIALSVVNDFFREKYKRRNRVALEGSPIEGHEVRNEVEALIHRVYLDQATQRITNQIDRMIVQSRLQGMSYKEISKQLLVSCAAAKMRYKRTVEFLNRTL